MMTMNGGPFGPLRQGKVSHPKVANPWVQTRPDFKPTGANRRPRPTTVTVAGTANGCCSDCASQSRSS